MNSSFFDFDVISIKARRLLILRSSSSLRLQDDPSAPPFDQARLLTGTLAPLLPRWLRSQSMLGVRDAYWQFACGSSYYGRAVSDGAVRVDEYYCG